MSSGPREGNIWTEQLQRHFGGPVPDPPPDMTEGPWCARFRELVLKTSGQISITPGPEFNSLTLEERAKVIVEALEGERSPLAEFEPQEPRLVQLESPFDGDTPEEIAANIDYARRCARHCFDLGEAPFVSHLLYTQMLDDKFKPHRRQGIEAGLAFARHTEASVVYTDRGITRGMKKGIARAESEGRPVEKRTLPIGYQQMKLPEFPGALTPRCKDCKHLQVRNQCAVLSRDAFHDFVEVLTYVDDPHAASPEGHAEVDVEVDPDQMGCRCFKQR